MAEQNNLEIYKGEAKAFNFTLDPLENCSGWTIRFTLKQRATDVASLLTINGVVTSGPDGQFSVVFAKADTLARAAGMYAYDVWRIDPGAENVLSIGTFKIRQEVLN